MKALYFNEHGGPEVMQYGDVPDLRPGPGEALVQVKAVALNHLDLWVRQGWPGLILPKPHIGGSDVAGLVASYGGGADGPALGTRVVIAGNTSGPKTEIDVRFIFAKQISLIGSTMGSHQDFRKVMELLWAGRLKPVIDRMMPLSEGRAAHELLATGQQFGKIVLEV